MRRFAFGTLSDPEFTLRSSPRITVRGHPVQGGSVPLRKALLPSRVYPWSTKRHCGPLAFRRATEGSRVPRKVRGVKRGQETMFGVLSPFAPVGGHRHPSAAGRRQCPACPSAAILASTGFAAVSAENLPSALDKAERALIACGGRSISCFR